MQKMMIVLAMSLGLLIACSRTDVTPKPKVDAFGAGTTLVSPGGPSSRR